MSRISARLSLAFLSPNLVTISPTADLPVPLECPAPPPGRWIPTDQDRKSNSNTTGINTRREEIRVHPNYFTPSIE
jgi:hypothetical protein